MSFHAFQQPMFLSLPFNFFRTNPDKSGRQKTFLHDNCDWVEIPWNEWANRKQHSDINPKDVVCVEAASKGTTENACQLRCTLREAVAHPRHFVTTRWWILRMILHFMLLILIFEVSINLSEPQLSLNSRKRPARSVVENVLLPSLSFEFPVTTTTIVNQQQLQQQLNLQPTAESRSAIESFGDLSPTPQRFFVGWLLSLIALTLWLFADGDVYRDIFDRNEENTEKYNLFVRFRRRENNENTFNRIEYSSVRASYLLDYLFTVLLALSSIVLFILFAITCDGNQFAFILLLWFAVALFALDSAPQIVCSLIRVAHDINLIDFDSIKNVAPGKERGIEKSFVKRRHPFSSLFVPATLRLTIRRFAPFVSTAASLLFFASAANALRSSNDFNDWSTYRPHFAMFQILYAPIGLQFCFHLPQFTASRDKFSPFFITAFYVAVFVVVPYIISGQTASTPLEFRSTVFLFLLCSSWAVLVSLLYWTLLEADDDLENMPLRVLRIFSTSEEGLQQGIKWLIRRNLNRYLQKPENRSRVCFPAEKNKFDFFMTPPLVQSNNKIKCDPIDFASDLYKSVHSPFVRKWVVTQVKKISDELATIPNELACLKLPADVSQIPPRQLLNAKAMIFVVHALLFVPCFKNAIDQFAAKRRDLNSNIKMNDIDVPQFLKIVFDEMLDSQNEAPMLPLEFLNFQRERDGTTVMRRPHSFANTLVTATMKAWEFSFTPPNFFCMTAVVIANSSDLMNELATRSVDWRSAAPWVLILHVHCVEPLPFDQAWAMTTLPQIPFLGAAAGRSFELCSWIESDLPYGAEAAFALSRSNTAAAASSYRMYTYFGRTKFACVEAEDRCKMVCPDTLTNRKSAQFLLFFQRR